MTPTNAKDEAVTAPEEERGRFANAGERIRETASHARTRASDAYEAARERTRSAYGSARERASGGFEANPAAALIGGLAIGAVIGALIPRTKQEAKLLGEWGKKLNASARDLAKKAKDTSITKLDEFGVSTAREKLKELSGNRSGK